MLPTLVHRTAEQKPTSEPYYNPFKVKREWPPDFTKLTQKQQFALERRYKRRVKLKWARPRWTKAVKLAQLGSIVFVTVYGVLFLDWKQEKQPFQGIRNRFEELKGSIWTRPTERVQRREKPDNASPAVETSRR